MCVPIVPPSQLVYRSRYVVIRYWHFASDYFKEKQEIRNLSDDFDLPVFSALLIYQDLLE